MLPAIFFSGVIRAIIVPIESRKICRLISVIYIKRSISTASIPGKFSLIRPSAPRLAGSYPAAQSLTACRPRADLGEAWMRPVIVLISARQEEQAFGINVVGCRSTSNRAECASAGVERFDGFRSYGRDCLPLTSPGAQVWHLTTQMFA